MAEVLSTRASGALPGRLSGRASLCLAVSLAPFFAPDADSWFSPETLTANRQVVLGYAQSHRALGSVTTDRVVTMAIAAAASTIDMACDTDDTVTG